VIKVTVSPAGTVILEPTSQADKKTVKDLLYVVRRKGKWVTFWTYLVDLRRDVPAGLLQWHPAATARIRALLRQVRDLIRGDDERIAGQFKPDRRPYDFQMQAIHAGLKAKQILIADDTGLGKLSPVDTPVLTPLGWREIGSIRKGDRVIGSDGKPTEVTGVFPQGVKPSYRVTFSDGSSAEAGPEHLWAVDYWRGGRTKSRIVITTDDLRLRPIKDGLDLSKTRLMVPMLSGPVEFDKGHPLPIPPYAMGALIANGGLTCGSAVLTYGTKDWDEIRNLIYEGYGYEPMGKIQRSANTTRASLLGAIVAVRDLKLDVRSQEKYIPTCYATASPVDRLKLLRGLMDADGSITKKRNRVTYHTISYDLAHDVAGLVQGLGGIGSVRRYDRTHEGKPVEYQVRVKMPHGINPFSLRRKADRYNPGPKAGPCRTIRTVEYVREAESVCISVAASDSLYVVKDHILTHNTIECLGIMLTAFRERSIKRAVLVVPAGLKHQWAEEIEEFALEAPDPVMIAVSGKNPRRRKQLYKKPWRVLIINPELVRIDEDSLREVANGVGFVALDEASCIRNEDSQIARVMKRLWASAIYKVALTATPVENRLADLWSIIRWVSPKAFLSRTYFDRHYIVWRKLRFKVKKRTGRTVTITKEEPLRYRNLREVESKIRHCYIRRRVSEVGKELPELVVQWDQLLLPKRQRAIYDAVKDKLEKKIKGLRGVALHAPLQALRQACNSTALVEKDRGQKHASVKIDRLRELLETEFTGEQVIVFTDYERFGRILKHELRAYRPVTYTGKMNRRDRQQAIDAFRLGDRRILIGTKALERGHNLQNAAIVVNIDLPFNPASVKQRLGRVRRLGSKHQTVRLWNMVVNDTVEERLIMRSLYAKRKLFEGIFESDELTDADPLERMVGGKLWDLL